MAAESSSSALQCFPLLGVMVGAGATLMGQWISARTTRQKDREAVQREDRHERKAVIMRFLDSTQRIEHLLGIMRDESTVDQQGADEDLHVMWLAVKEVIIVCCPDTASAADDYCEALYGEARRGATDRAIKRGCKAALPRCGSDGPRPDSKWVDLTDWA